jgi:superfamily II DNA or RNA helicase
LFNALKTSPNALTDLRTTLNDALALLEPGTRRWALDEVFAHVVAATLEHRVLVFEADAGMGKTVIAAAAIAALQAAGHVVVSV